MVAHSASFRQPIQEYAPSAHTPEAHVNRREIAAILEVAVDAWPDLKRVRKFASCPLGSSEVLFEARWLGRRRSSRRLLTPTNHAFREPRVGSAR